MMTAMEISVARDDLAKENTVNEQSGTRKTDINL